MKDSRNLGEEKKGTGSRNRRERQFLGCIGDERSKNWGKGRLPQGGKEGPKWLGITILPVLCCHVF